MGSKGLDFRPEFITAFVLLGIFGVLFGFMMYFDSQKTQEFSSFETAIQEENRESINKAELKEGVLTVISEQGNGELELELENEGDTRAITINNEDNFSFSIGDVVSYKQYIEKYISEENKEKLIPKHNQREKTIIEQISKDN